MKRGNVFLHPGGRSCFRS